MTLPHILGRARIVAGGSQRELEGRSAAQAIASAESRGHRSAMWFTYVYGLAVALALGHFLLGLPIQVSDSFGNMLKLSASWWDLIWGEFTQRAYLRPFLWAGLKAVYDLSGGDYTVWYRGTHVVQVMALVLLYLTIVRPRTWRDASLVPLGLAVLVGLHTFVGTVREAFPINTHMTVLILSFASAAVALSSYRWWNDALAALLFICAALTVETGLLVWVIFIGAALVGARGVSRGGLATLILLLGGYFYLRFAVFDVGAPNLLERSSGFGFGIIERDQLMARFGDNPLPFYAYNVITSAVSVLFSEPTGGVFSATRALLDGNMRPVVFVNLISSVGIVAVLATYIGKRRLWARRTFDYDDRLVLLFLMVLAANAVISYPYTKDVIMSPAGAFLAIAAVAAARGVSASWQGRLTPVARVAVAICVVVVSSAWALRYVGLHNELRRAAVTERLDWAYIHSSVAEGDVQVPGLAADALMRQLREEALVAYPAPAQLDLPVKPLFGIDD